jgi:retron-type reverse transcriptase
MGLIGGVANVKDCYANLVYKGSPVILSLDCFFKHNNNFYISCLGFLNKLIFSPYKTYYDIGGTYYDYSNNIEKKLAKIEKSIKSGSYKFSPYARKVVKVRHKQRVLYLATWADKMVERYLAIGLNRYLAQWFSGNSYAYRSGRFGLDVCQTRVSKACKPQMFVIRRDIADYFYNISQEQLDGMVRQLIDKNDLLYSIIKQRIFFECNEGAPKLGVAFGSPLACVLANIYLTRLDRKIEKLPLSYFRYADDFLMIAYDEATARKAIEIFSSGIEELGLTTKESHTQNILISNHKDVVDGFIRRDKFKFLGLEFTGENKVRLSKEKQRKIINLFSKELKLIGGKLRKIKVLDDRLKEIIKAVDNVLNNRIRSVAIIDYYIKHVNDESQLRLMDLMIAKKVISMALNKPFRYRDFSKISYKKLRQLGLSSLVHRHRLHVQGHIKVPFLRMYNELSIKRHEDAINRRHNRIQQAEILRKLKKMR